jgi:CDP-diacylglycerol---glycerol-3-phosphate 3-phosphatidyltransferase
VLVDAIDGRVLEHLVEDNPEEWAERDSVQPMFDGKFRAPVDAAVKPLGAALRKTKLTPDHLTIARARCSVWALPSRSAPASCGSGLVLVILAALPDLLDGALAKASDTASQRGAFFDSTVDRITDSCPARRHRLVLRDTRESPHIAVLPFAVIGGRR